MSTSAEVVLRDGAVARLSAVPYDDPVAQLLVERVQQEYVARYGGPDGAAVDPAEFRPPRGLFLVAEVDGVPAGCGAWRAVEPGTVEVKRVYVEPGYRRRGLAKVLMTALEDSAARAGYGSVVLSTGDRQPEALELYSGLGYRPVVGYGIYACAPGAVFLGKDLARGPDGGTEDPWAS